MSEEIETSQEIDVVVRTLEICGETLGDIVPAVFDRFFALSEPARELMFHSDQYMRGRMFEAVLDLLMSDVSLASGGYLEWELDNHIDAYKASPEMYEAFFAAVREVVERGVGDRWGEEHSRAWTQRIRRIMQQVHAHG